jgi:hypothetical protein
MRHALIFLYLYKRNRAAAVALKWALRYRVRPPPDATCSNDWNGVTARQETASAHLNADRSRTALTSANVDVIISVVERELRRISRDIASELELSSKHFMTINCIHKNYRFAKMKYWYSYNYYNYAHYLSSHPLFKTRRFGDWTLSPFSDGSYSGGPNMKS